MRKEERAVSLPDGVWRDSLGPRGMSIQALLRMKEVQRLSALLAVVALSSPAIQQQLDHLLPSVLLGQISVHEAQAVVSQWLDQVREINPELVCIPQDVAWLMQLESDESSGEIRMIILLLSVLQLVAFSQQASEGESPFVLISDLARQTHRSDEQWRAVITRTPERYAALQIRGQTSHPRLWFLPRGIASSLRLLSPQRGRSASRSPRAGIEQKHKETEE